MKPGPVTPKFLFTSATDIDPGHRHEQIRRNESAGTRSMALPAALAADPVRTARAGAWLLGAIALLLLLCGSVRAGQTASLAWDASGSTGVVGYAVYRGTNSGVYTARYDVGTNNNITLTGLKEGQTNYFTVASYNSARMESPASTPVAYIIPGLARLTQPTHPGGLAGVSFPVAPGHTYSVQASTNLSTWTTVYTTPSATSNAWVSWQDPQTSSFSKRFYRLILN